MNNSKIQDNTFHVTNITKDRDAAIRESVDKLSNNSGATKEDASKFIQEIVNSKDRVVKKVIEIIKLEMSMYKGDKMLSFMTSTQLNILSELIIKLGSTQSILLEITDDFGDEFLNQLEVTLNTSMKACRKTFLENKHKTHI